MTTPTRQPHEQGKQIDPTENVLALVAAQAKAQAEFREDDKAFAAANLANMKEIATLRADHARELRLGEADRLSKVREVDVQAASQQAALLANAVQALAVTTDRNAETLRAAMASNASTLAKQVSDTAAATANMTQAANTAIEKRISDLEKMQNLGAGRQSVADPMMDKVMERLERISVTQDRTTGKTEGISATWALIGGGIMFAVTMLSMFWPRAV